MDDPKSLTDRIWGLVADERGMCLDKILPESRLEEDLGMTGDDAAEFLEQFARDFDVDLTDLDFHKHFGPECFFVPGWLQAELDAKGYGEYPITVAHLVDVASAKRWFYPPKGAGKKPSSLPQRAMWDRQLDG
jgi:uncharacterized protein DUF1493